MNLSLQVLLLTNKLKNDFNLESVDDASALLFSNFDENNKKLKKIAESKEYEDFLTTHYSDVQKASEILQNINNSRFYDWVRVTFFLASRVDGGWDLGQTSGLRQTALAAILKLIESESNGSTLDESKMVSATVEGNGEELNTNDPGKQ